MKRKVSVKGVVALVALLFCIPIGNVYAGSVPKAETLAEEGGIELGSNEGWSGTVSENKVPDTGCICKGKCTQYSVDEGCEICKKDFGFCDYVKPDIKITIPTPPGWHNDTTKVYISIEDMAHSGNLAIKTVQAKITQNGNWMDITEDMYVEISENTTVYVLLTDQEGKTYEKNRYIKCFDFTKPTLNAAVSDGLLSVQAYDTDSGVKAVYVNGYEFKELTNGVLNIRLQQFDAGYQYFAISAMDNAGNMSETYKTVNPYYTDPEKDDGSGENPERQLPVNAQATKPSSATAQVTEHTKTDNDGNTVSGDSLFEQKERAMMEVKTSENSEEARGEEKGKTGKEFYTIQAASGKVFYLIIDRNGEGEMVYFLTEATENDLLNMTADNSETLPKNSAALESAIPVTESSLSNNREQEKGEVTEEGQKGSGNVEETRSKHEKAKETPVVAYVIFGVVAVMAIVGGYYFKIAKGKGEGFLDEDDEEDEDGYENEEEYEDEEEDDFFNSKEGK